MTLLFAIPALGISCGDGAFLLALAVCAFFFYQVVDGIKEARRRSK